MAFADQATLSIDLSALVRNWQQLKTQAKSDIGATVKANAYSLGVDHVAPALYAAGCNTFFVAALTEGVALRTILPAASIYIYSGLGAPDVAVFNQHSLKPVLNTAQQVALWADQNPSPGAALHVDTGMSRLGCDAADIAALSADPALIDRAGITILMSHFACADTPDHRVNRAQIERFTTLHRLFPQLRTSLSNSAGTLNAAVAQSDLSRPGIGIYGGNPRPGMAMQMESVVTLTAPILQVRHVKAGETIGYGADFTAPKDMRTATIGIGYADGIPRNIAGKAEVIIAGQRCAVLGRISMDTLVADVSAIAQPPRHAEIIGDHITIDDMAEWAGTISYEILTGLGQRLERRYSVGDR
ncbi:MAG: alanine racemase [Pseudomonadota bacterium]